MKDWKNKKDEMFEGPNLKPLIYSSHVTKELSLLGWVLIAMVKTPNNLKLSAQFLGECMPFAW